MIKAQIQKIADSALLENVDIEAKEVIIGENTELKDVQVETKGSFIVGSNTKITKSKLFSNSAIEIGNSVEIKEGSVFKGFKGVKVGNGTIIDRGVIIGGMQSEHSFFEIGERGVILHHSYINTTREVIIGNNVGIGGYCMIFTHGVWQNAFKGYPLQFGKVKIDDDVWLAWHVFVMPNISVGKGTTIAGGSVVTNDLPEHCLAAGVPAKIIRQQDYPKQLTVNEKDALAKKMLKDFGGYVKDFLGNTLKEVDVSKSGILLKSDLGQIYYNQEIDELPKLPHDCDIISFKIPEVYKGKSNWIELETETRSQTLNKLSLQLVQFLRRYGVRIK